MNTEQGINEDIRQIRNEIAELRADVKTFTEQAHHLQATALLAEFRNTCADAIVNGYREAGCDAIGKEANECPLWENCRPVFGNLFGEMLERLRAGKLTSGDISLVREKAAALRSKAPFERCSGCHEEAEKQIIQQLGMLRAIGAYREESNTGDLVRAMPEDEAAALFSDSLSSPVRIQIVKALYREGKSFTDLSKMTGLRGGNLLFHLEKLQKSGMILQRGERGEYQITCRGYEVLNAVAELLEKLHG
jgi:DNA-binding transcriptional ArsR family regulator